MFGGILLGLCIAAIFVLFSNTTDRYDNAQTQLMKAWVRLASYVVFFPSFAGFIGWVLELIL